MPEATYRMPAGGWVCFHCGERFMTPGSARDHFGPTPSSAAACTMDLSERALLILLRGKEEELETCRKARSRLIVEVHAFRAGEDPQAALADYEARLEAMS